MAGMVVVQVPSCLVYGGLIAGMSAGWLMRTVGFNPVGILASIRPVLIHTLRLRAVEAIPTDRPA